MIAALEALKKMKDLAPSDRDKMATMQISTQTSSGFKKLFMSHPPLQERIDALHDLQIN